MNVAAAAGSSGLAVAVLLCATFVLGGGTHAGFLADAALHVAALPVFYAALCSLPAHLGTRCAPTARSARALLFLLAAFAAAHVLMLIPLPKALVSTLPGREYLAQLEAVHPSTGWLIPISVNPRATALSLVSLSLPAAIFLGTLQLGTRDRHVLCLAVVAVTTLGVGLGLLQVAQGPDSPLRFFEVTNRTEAVGFFANRNHFASLLAVAIPVTTAAILVVSTARASGSGGVGGFNILAAVGAFVVLVALLSGQLMARSRAGLGLTMLALVGSFAVAMGSASVQGYTRTTGRLLIAATAVALLFATQFALYRLLQRFGADPLEDARLIFGRNTYEAAKAYLPFGAGFGTFVPAYAELEPPTDVLRVFANRAHNDLLELWLEAGLLGFALLGAFGLWFLERVWRTWKRSHDGVTVERIQARAATLVIALLMLHSLVDYPLRTAALSGLFAFACALLLPARDGVWDAGHANGRKPAGSPTPSRPRGRRQPAVTPQRPAEVPPVPGDKPVQRWQGEAHWPADWHQVPHPPAAKGHDPGNA